MIEKEFQVSERYLGYKVTEKYLPKGKFTGIHSPYVPITTTRVVMNTTSTATVYAYYDGNY